MLEIQLVLNDKYYLKDPQSSDLGRRIVRQGIMLLDELGYEAFTFRKLAESIGSTEASVYRYFENKHMLLLYLATWYWKWIDYLIDYHTHHEANPRKKLRTIFQIITQTGAYKTPLDSTDFDLLVLRNVVMTESDKTYLTKRVDEINQMGLFRNYKALCHHIALVILEINKDFRYPHALVSTLMEAAHQQAFFAEHLPSLTEIQANGNDIDQQVCDFIESMAFSWID